MKRILFSLLFINLLSVTCYAQDCSDEGNYSISLTYVKGPDYTVRIPKTVDVIEPNTTMYFYVKGDIYADQTLEVVFDASTIISYNGTSIPVTVSQSKRSWTCSELRDSYVSSSVSISHQQLNAGTWVGYMNVAISLQGGN